MVYSAINMSLLLITTLVFAPLVASTGVHVTIGTDASAISSKWEAFVESVAAGPPQTVGSAGIVAPDVRQYLQQRCKGKDLLAWEVPPLKEVLIEADVKSKCRPGEQPFGDRLVVIARHKENIDWLATLLEVPYLVYSTAGDEARHTAVNIGNEVGPYLTFIAEYYDCLPKAMLFAHAHRFSKAHSVHTLDYDANTVQWNKIPGFAPKHRIGLWHEVDHIQNPDLNWQHPIKITMEQAKTFNCLEVRDGVPYDQHDSIMHLHASMVSRAWDEYLGPAGLGPKPEKIRTSVAAEMFVTAEAIRKHPRSFYLQGLGWMRDGLFRFAYSKWALGGVYELTWHIIFGQPAYMEKYPIPVCELFRCNMTSAIQDNTFVRKGIAEIKAKERAANIASSH